MKVLLAVVLAGTAGLVAAGITAGQAAGIPIPQAIKRLVSFPAQLDPVDETL